MPFNLRIQAGSFKGKKIKEPPSVRGELHVTPAIVKKAVFQLFENRATDLGSFAFFDLCSGSGQIAAEAYSRGYRPVHACELDQARFAHVLGWAKQEGLDLTMHRKDMQRMVTPILGCSYACVYIDLPYTFWKGGQPDILDHFFSGIYSSLFTSNVRELHIIIQAPAPYESKQPDEPTIQWFTKDYGRTYLTIWDYVADV